MEIEATALLTSLELYCWASASHIFLFSRASWTASLTFLQIVSSVVPPCTCAYHAINILQQTDRFCRRINRADGSIEQTDQFSRWNDSAVRLTFTVSMLVITSRSIVGTCSFDMNSMSLVLPHPVSPMMITGMLTLQHIEMVKYVSNHIYQILHDHKILRCDFECRFSSFKNFF